MDYSMFSYFRTRFKYESEIRYGVYLSRAEASLSHLYSRSRLIHKKLTRSRLNVFKKKKNVYTHFH